MPRRTERPNRVRIRYFEVEYWLDLHRCRSAFVQLRIEGGIGGASALADRVDLSRSTVSRFFAGRSHSTEVVRRILSALMLNPDDVLMLIEPTEKP